MFKNNKCSYVYVKGPKARQPCGKHSPEKNKTIEVGREKDNETIVSTIDVEEEDRPQSVKPSSVRSENSDILITKYFVYDCIRDFLRDYDDVNKVLGNKIQQPSGGSNMSTILTMAGIGCLPILLKNLSGNNIIDAISKQTVNNTACDIPRVYGQYDEVRSYATQERTSQEGVTQARQVDPNREIQASSEIIYQRNRDERRV